MAEGQYSDPDAAAYLVKTLKERRDKTGQYWFGQVNPIDDFRLVQKGDGHQLTYNDLSVDTGLEKAVQITLSTAGTVTTVTLPNDARGFKIVPQTNNVYFAVNGTVADLATSSLTTIPASAFSRNGICYADSMEVRLLPDGTDRTLQLRSPVDSTVLDLEVF